jgi:hypothetical protein
MTPEEKAKELVHKMFNVDLQCDNEAMCMLYPHAIKCALISVDEVLKTLYFQKEYKYWKEVKHELEKL